MSQRPPHVEETKPLDPVALPLVLWLGLMVCVLGVQRMAEQAADQRAPAAGGGVSSDHAGADDVCRVAR